MSKKARVLVISPKCSSRSAEYLSQLLGCEYRLAGLTRDYTDFDVVINYGSSAWAKFNHVINKPEQVKICVNKISTLKRVKHGVKWTKDREEASLWLAEHEVVVARELECGSRSVGTTIIQSLEDFNSYKAKFWTQFFHHDHEVRINVFNGEILSVFDKVEEDGCFVFVPLEINGTVPQVQEMIDSISKNIGISFYGMDVLVNSDGECCLLEVNSGATIHEGTEGVLVKKFKKEIANYATV